MSVINETAITEIRKLMRSHTAAGGSLGASGEGESSGPNMVDTPDLDKAAREGFFKPRTSNFVGEGFNVADAGSIGSIYASVYDQNMGFTLTAEEETGRFPNSGQGPNNKDRTGPPTKENRSLEQQIFDKIAFYEDFQATGKWDVTSYRAGMGSDTTTRADGTIVKVTKGMVVTREDAERDLKRRSKDFAGGVEAQVGSSKWKALPNVVKVSIVSFAYNYGSLNPKLVKAVKSGDLNNIAAAIRDRKGDNKGVNAHRRENEASDIEMALSGSEFAATGVRNP